MTKLEQQFKDAMKLHPGENRGFPKEYQNFRKKYKMKAKDIIPLMIPNITRRIAYYEACDKAGMWHADWPYFQTWINQGRWTQEPPVSKKKRIKTCMFCGSDLVTNTVDGKGSRCGLQECIEKFNLL